MKRGKKKHQEVEAGHRCGMYGQKIIEPCNSLLFKWSFWGEILYSALAVHSPQQPSCWIEGRRRQSRAEWHLLERWRTKQTLTSEHLRVFKRLSSLPLLMSCPHFTCSAQRNIHAYKKYPISLRFAACRHAGAPAAVWAKRQYPVCSSYLGHLRNQLPWIM